MASWMVYSRSFHELTSMYVRQSRTGKQRLGRLLQSSIENENSICLAVDLVHLLEGKCLEGRGLEGIEIVSTQKGDVPSFVCAWHGSGLDSRVHRSSPPNAAVACVPP